MLLDPAVGLDGEWMREIADAMLASPDFADRAEARADKTSGSWGEVDAAEVDAELDEHLVDLPNGRVRLADQHPGDDVLLERAGPANRVAPQGNADDVGRRARTPIRRTSPTSWSRRCAQQLGADFTPGRLRLRSHGAETKPAETAALIRELMG